MATLYRVHEVAELTGVTVKALHHYDRLGLLTPRRTDAGYRLYTRRDLERLRQIVALRGIGLPLKQIKNLLDADPSSLPDLLRIQRLALEAQRRRLERAIGAIGNAERAIRPGVWVIETLIEVIEMEDRVDLMKRYFSEDAWASVRHHYEEWPSGPWRALYREVEASLDLDPASAAAQSLAARWLALTERDAGGNRAALAGFWRAWTDRDRWPPALQKRLAEFRIDEIARFIGDAVWTARQLACDARSTGAYRAPDRVGATRMALFRDIEASLREDPGGGLARSLVARWDALLDHEAAGDAESKDAMRDAWARRKHWPIGMRTYVASLYMTERDAWERVADFIDRTRAAGASPRSRDD